MICLLCQVFYIYKITVAPTTNILYVTPFLSFAEVWRLMYIQYTVQYVHR